MKLAHYAAAGALALAVAAPAAAALPFGSLTFLQPTGTVGPTDSIDVRLRLTIDPLSAPLFLDSTAPNFGLSLADIPDNGGFEQWLAITGANTSISFGCSGTFTTSCLNGPPYNFAFNVTPIDSFILTDINLAPGDSYDYRLGTFSPSAGPVAAGVYSFFFSNALLQIQGSGYKQATDADGNLIFDADGKPVYIQDTDADGNPLFDVNGQPVLKVFDDLFFSPDIATAGCVGPDPGCQVFTREVIAANPVPEPETYAMLLAGLGLLALARRRKV